MSNYPINIPNNFIQTSKNVNKEDMESFGDFKSAPKIDEYNELMKKLDYIISEINMIKMEVREIKQNQQQTYTTFPPILPPPPKPIMYPVTPAYPGQPMPPYPHQQMLYGNQNMYSK